LKQPGKATGPRRSREATSGHENGDSGARVGLDAPSFGSVLEALSRDEFERVVEEALELLPQRFNDLIKNVVIAVEEEPTDEDFESTEGEDDDELLGIYRGVALTERSHDDPLLPDEIAVFRGPINRIARNRVEAVEEVRETLIHELGHYFGLCDEEMPY
jgi:predicted Zn-dependent protease with MMP-like domain